MLRSESCSLLTSPKTHITIYGDKFLRASVPEWEIRLLIIINLDIFCKGLKTHLVKLSHL